MAFPEWSDSLIVGIADFDRDHRMMVTGLEALHRVVTALAPLEALMVPIDELASLVDRHFAAEEVLMAGLTAPVAVQHRQAHRAAHDEFRHHLARIHRTLLMGLVTARDVEELAFALTRAEMVRFDFELAGILLREGLLRPDGQLVRP